MSEPKSYKLSQKKRDYFKEVQHKRRWTCSVPGCPEQAFAKVLLTKKRVCAKHLVAPLKEELLKQQKEKQLSQPTQTAPVQSATIQAAPASSV